MPAPPRSAAPPRVEPTGDSPQRTVEREALKLALQSPVLAGPMFDSVDASAYAHPLHAAIRVAIARVRRRGRRRRRGRLDSSRSATPARDLAAKALVAELAVEPLHLDREPDPRYVTVTLARLQLPSLTRRIADLKSKLQRLNPVQHVEEHLRLFGELVSLEQHARALRNQAAGGL